MAGRTVPPAVLHELSGAHLENIVLHHLMCWREGRVEHTEILYWRTTTGDEVDFVIETGGPGATDRNQSQVATSLGLRRDAARISN
jgi:predicted AAA+ superfamily ATPase